MGFSVVGRGSGIDVGFEISPSVVVDGAISPLVGVDFGSKKSAPTETEICGLSSISTSSSPSGGGRGDGDGVIGCPFGLRDSEDN